MTRNHRYALSLMGMLVKEMDVVVSYNASNDTTKFAYGKTVKRVLNIDRTTDNEQALNRFNELVEIIKSLKESQNGTV